MITLQRQDSNIRARVSSLKQDLNKSNRFHVFGGLHDIVSPKSRNVFNSFQRKVLEKKKKTPVASFSFYRSALYALYVSETVEHIGFARNREKLFTLGLRFTDRLIGRHTHTCIYNSLCSEFERWGSKPCQSKKKKARQLCAAVL